ncbi:hypothetical protein [Arthrobacter sp. NPDC090010]|uniref:hypothetical protein n=1 Tax=Arthrobacter sp. NPDC090010 TaxID=3363942 RepID=UPI003800D2A5
MLKKLTAGAALVAALGLGALNVSAATSAVGNWPDPTTVQAVGNWPDPARMNVGNWPDPTTITASQTGATQLAVGNWPDPF